jgi:hypothetical protein
MHIYARSRSGSRIVPTWDVLDNEHRHVLAESLSDIINRKPIEDLADVLQIGMRDWRSWSINSSTSRIALKRCSIVDEENATLDGLRVAVERVDEALTKIGRCPLGLRKAPNPMPSRLPVRGYVDEVVISLRRRGGRASSPHIRAPLCVQPCVAGAEDSERLARRRCCAADTCPS